MHYELIACRLTTLLSRQNTAPATDTRDRLHTQSHFGVVLVLSSDVGTLHQEVTDRQELWVKFLPCCSWSLLTNNVALNFHFLCEERVLQHTLEQSGAMFDQGFNVLHDQYCILVVHQTPVLVVRPVDVLRVRSADNCARCEL